MEDADSGTYYISNRYVLQGFLSTFSDSNNADIFVTDAQGEPFSVRKETTASIPNKNVPDPIMKEVLNNGFVSTSNLGGIYPYSHFTVGGCRWRRRGRPGGRGVPLPRTRFYLTAFRNDVLKMFLFAAIAALTIPFLPWACSRIKWCVLCGKWRKPPGALALGISQGAAGDQRR